MKKEEIKEINEIEETSDCRIYDNGNYKEVPNNYTFKVHIDIPKWVKSMELDEQEELIDWIIEKINERQSNKDSEPRIFTSADGTVKINAVTATLTADKNLKKD